MGLFRRRPKHQPSIEVTDEGVRRVVADGTVEGAVDPGDFLKRFEALEGFDLETFIEAMGSTEEQIFVCWRRP